MAPTPAQVALRGCCPRCGGSPLFVSTRLSGLLKLRPRCTACGLDYDRFNVGDGAAPFLIFIVATIVIIASQVVEFRLHPPMWVHVLLWVPVTLALSLALLRLSKGLFVALEFRHSAGEGRSS